MRVAEALSQIDAIHEQLTKAEVYAGFRVPGVAAAGALGLAAAAAQPWLVTPDGVGFVAYWVAVAGACAALGAGAALHSYCVREDEFARRRTRRVLAQFLPCLLAGAAVTFALPRFDPALVGLLPGLWALLFGLGVLAARPYLPRAVGWVSLLYLGCGALLLAQAAPGADPTGWAVGGVFGAGHLATALVLRVNRERHDA